MFLKNFGKAWDTHTENGCQKKLSQYFKTPKMPAMFDKRAKQPRQLCQLFLTKSVYFF